LDLFAGCGGSSWGAKESGVHLIAAVDSWTLARNTYVDNFSGVKFYCKPIESIDPIEIEREVGKIDLILASPECTSHTCARGNSPRSENSRMTAFEVVRFARVLKPRWMVIENVVHMRKWDKYRAFLDTIRQELKYQVREQILNANAFGVPQSRRRLFILCDRDNLPPSVTSKPDIPKILAKDIVDSDGNYAYSPLVTDRRAKPTLERAERAFSNIGRDQPFLIVYYGSDAAGGWQLLDRPLRTVTTLDRFAYVKPSGGGHLMRMLQVPEIKVAMGFPHQYKLMYGTRRDKIHLLGNAVCPPVMSAIIQTLIGTEET